MQHPDAVVRVVVLDKFRLNIRLPLHASITLLLVSLRILSKQSGFLLVLYLLADLLQIFLLISLDLLNLMSGDLNLVVLQFGSLILLHAFLEQAIVEPQEMDLDVVYILKVVDHEVVLR